jgi:hypothetical protein
MFQSGGTEASGLLFQASRQKPSGSARAHLLPVTLGNERFQTKSGATPDLTGGTPVPPNRRSKFPALAILMLDELVRLGTVLRPQIF